MEGGSRDWSDRTAGWQRVSQGRWVAYESREKLGNKELPPQPCQHLDFKILYDPGWTSDRKNCKQINLCCFRPLSL